jgi:hypothetical protein
VDIADYLKSLQETAFRLYGLSPSGLQNHSDRLLAITQTLIGNRLSPRTPEFELAMATHLTMLAETERLLPTPYEDPNWYAILMRIVKRVERAIPAVYTSYDPKVNANVVFGTLRSGHVNATSMKIEGIDGALVVIEDGLFLFAHLMAKIFSSALPVSSRAGTRVAFLYDRDSIRSRIASNPQLPHSFLDVLKAFIVEGHPSRAAVYFIEALYAPFANYLTEAFEHFLIAHEYAHLVLGHLDPSDSGLESVGLLPLEEGVRAMQYSWEQEVAADQLGLLLTMVCMQEMHLPFDIGYAGAVMFLMCREIVEKFVDIVTRGQEIGFAVELRSAGPNAEDVPNVAVPTYPPVKSRCEAMRNLIRKSYSESAYEHITSFESGLTAITEELFESIRPNLFAMHQNRVEVAYPWRWDRHHSVISIAMKG